MFHGHWWATICLPPNWRQTFQLRQTPSSTISTPSCHSISIPINAIKLTFPPQPSSTQIDVSIRLRVNQTHLYALLVSACMMLRILYFQYQLPRLHGYLVVRLLQKRQIAFFHVRFHMKNVLFPHFFVKQFIVYADLVKDRFSKLVPCFPKIVILPPPLHRHDRLTCAQRERIMILFAEAGKASAPGTSVHSDAAVAHMF